MSLIDLYHDCKTREEFDSRMRTINLVMYYMMEVRKVC